MRKVKLKKLVDALLGTGIGECQIKAFDQQKDEIDVFYSGTYLGTYTFFDLYKQVRLDLGRRATEYSYRRNKGSLMDGVEVLQRELESIPGDRPLVTVPCRVPPDNDYLVWVHNKRVEERWS